MHPIEQIANDLGKDAADSAWQTGDWERYDESPDDDLDDLAFDYWKNGPYEGMATEAVAGLSAEDRATLADENDEALLQRLYDLFEKAFLASYA